MRSAQVWCALLLGLLLATSVAAAEIKMVEDAIDNVTYFTVTPKTPAADKKLGLFLVFHGRDGKAEPIVSGMVRKLAAHKLGDRFVVVGVYNDRKPLWYDWSKTAVEVVEKIIAKTLKDQPGIDPRRVYSYGLSAGAFMAGAIAANRPRLVAAALAYGMGIDQEAVVDDKKTPTPPMYLAIGSEDPHRYYADPSVAKLRGCKVPVVYRYMSGLGHSFKHAEVNQDGIAWTVAQRNELIPLAADDQALLKLVLKPTTDKPLTRELIIQAGNVGGSAAGAALVPVLAHKDPALVVAAIQTMGGTWCGVESIRAVAKKLKDPLPEIRDAAFDLMAKWANWRVPLAQEALVAALRSPTPAERMQSLKALRVALALQVPAGANIQDPPLVQAVVAALGDSDVGVRTAAYEVLKPAKGPDFDPAAEPTLRNKSFSAWKAWATPLKPQEFTDKGLKP